MKPRTILSPLVLAAGLLFYSVGCTDLTDTVDSQVTAETFFQNDQQFVSAMGDAYSRLTALGGGGSPAQFNEATTDEIIVPARGQDWSEGGFWYRVNSHSWTEADGTFNGFWNTYFSGINNANRLIFQFESAVESGAADPALAETFISELVAMRAFYYFWLLDAFGNVPIVTSFVDAEEKPSQPSSDFAEGRRMVFQFVEKELLDNVGNLSTDTRGTYGRMNQYVARMTLVNVYLNSEFYTGTGRWGDALTQLNEI
ncbi:MAG: RagB/SusD family nutrient uptake outer membrane protein, partial [Rhodothermaceae bacterium]|nr:RagB/SusD family nutrient uptake outer membrane protein [Rhodothermaceae bacterium]